MTDDTAWSWFVSASGLIRFYAPGILIRVAAPANPTATLTAICWFLLDTVRYLGLRSQSPVLHARCTTNEASYLSSGFKVISHPRYVNSYFKLSEFVNILCQIAILHLLWNLIGFLVDLLHSSRNKSLWRWRRCSVLLSGDTSTQKTVAIYPR